MTLYTAIHLAERAHASQKREDGSPFLEHPLTVLRLLWKLDLDLPLAAYMAAVLHDVLEDTATTYEDVLLSVGAEVAAVVRALSKDDVYYSMPRGVRERMYLKRIAAVNKTYGYTLLIKMADRLHNILTSKALATDKQERLIDETKTIYVPFLQEYLEENDVPFLYSYKKMEATLHVLLDTHPLSKNM